VFCAIVSHSWLRAEVLRVLGRAFPLTLVDRRVHCSCSHCVMSRGKRYWVFSRGLPGILTLSCLLKCKILADLVAKC